MRSRVTMALVAMLGCRDSGLLIEVEAPPGTDVVRLYVGVSEAERGNVTPFDHAPIGGFFWPRDASGELDVQQLAAGETTARFVFTAGSPGTPRPAAIIAVGFTDDIETSAAVLLDPQMPDDFIAKYELSLRPASPATGLHVWGPQPGDQTCALVKDDTSPDGATASFVVTPEDPDCDGLLTGDPLECAPQTFRARTRAALEDTRCLAKETLTGPGGAVVEACTLGGPSCQDGVPDNTDECLPTRYCMPTTTCSACESRDLGCAATEINVHCTFYTVEQSGTVAFCPGPAKLRLSGPVGQVACAGDYRFWQAARASWAAGIKTTDGVYTADPTPDCTLVLRPPAAPLTVTPGDTRSLMAVDLSNGRGFALGVQVLVEPPMPSCVGVNECHLEFTQDDSFVTCYTTPLHQERRAEAPRPR